MESESTIFLFLSVIAALGRVVAFAIYPKLSPQQPEENDGSKAQTFSRISFTVRAIFEARSYLEYNFGKKLFSIEKFLKVAAVSAFIVLGLFIFSHAISDTAWQSPSDKTTGGGVSVATRLVVIGTCLIVLILWNAVFEMFSLSIVRHLIAPFDRLRLDDQRRRRLMWRYVSLPIYLIAIYLCFLATMNAAFSVIIAIRGTATGYLQWVSIGTLWEIQLNIWSNETLARLIDPVGEGRAISIGDANLLVFCVMPLVPLFLITVISATGFLLDAVDLASGGQITSKLDNEDHGRHNKVFAAALIIALIGGMTGAMLGG